MTNTSLEESRKAVLEELLSLYGEQKLLVLLRVHGFNPSHAEDIVAGNSQSFFTVEFLKLLLGNRKKLDKIENLKNLRRLDAQNMVRRAWNHIEQNPDGITEEGFYAALLTQEDDE